MSKPVKLDALRKTSCSTVTSWSPVSKVCIRSPCARVVSLACLWYAGRGALVMYCQASPAVESRYQIPLIPLAVEVCCAVRTLYTRWRHSVTNMPHTCTREHVEMHAMLIVADTDGNLSLGCRKANALAG